MQRVRMLTRMAGPELAAVAEPETVIEVLPELAARLVSGGFAVYETAAVRAPEYRASDDFTRIPTINSELACMLQTYGYNTFEDLRRAADADLLKLSGIGPGRLARIRAYLEGR